VLFALISFELNISNLLQFNQLLRTLPYYLAIANLCEEMLQYLYLEESLEVIVIKLRLCDLPMRCQLLPTLYY